MSQHKLCSTLAVALLAASQAAGAVDYPEGYRDWSHVKTLILDEGHPLANPFAGMHHVYANPAALAGLRSGTYADGAVFVFDLLEANAGDHATAEGKRILLGVMEKDRAHHGDTGGWGFAAWAGDSRSETLVQDGGRACFACHASEQAADYVFSRWRD